MSIQDRPSQHATEAALTRGSALLAVIAGILAAPCAVTLLLLPLGLSGAVAAAGGMWLDRHRIWFMVASLILILFTHAAYHRMQSVRAALSLRMGAALPQSPWERRSVWIATLVSVAFIVAELALDWRWA